ncbi:SMC-Scp complex subunit ScpB [Candidatus Woesearchaeota archaeon]|nr:SMC-Scp complex subunit ScpB [Candidatus Woesearchaeota archaeon]
MGNKEKIEALLFSSGKKMSVEELMKLCRLREDDVLSALREVKEDYDRKGGSFKLVEEGRDWKFVVKEEFLPLVSKIVTETELPKTVLETLAVIAFRYPIKQSDLIHMRTNKAYDHLALLENSGYITRVKYGRTKLIKLTQKFFEYFDLPPEKLKEKFESFDEIAKAIEMKEGEIKKIKEEQKRKAEDVGKAAKEVDLVDEDGNKVELEEYESTPIEVEKEEEKAEVEVFEEPSEEEAPEKELEVYDSEKKEERTEEGEQSEEKDGEVEGKEEQPEEAEEKEMEEKEEEPEAEEEKEGEEKPKKKEDGAVDKRVEEILHPKKEEE